MTGLLVLGVLAAVFVLYAVDRVMKALLRARHRRRMSERLAAATARAGEQQAQRAAAAAAVAEASAALTSVMPAINRPPLTLPGQVTRDEGPPG